MGPAERAIRDRYPLNREVTLHTIGKGASFGVVVRDGATRFLLGSVEPRTPKLLEWAWWEGTAGFLSGHEWVAIGGSHISTGDAGTVDGFLKNRHQTHIANYVAAVLEDVGLVDARVVGTAVQIRLRRQT